MSNIHMHLVTLLILLPIVSSVRAQKQGSSFLQLKQLEKAEYSEQPYLGSWYPLLGIRYLNRYPVTAAGAVMTSAAKRMRCTAVHEDCSYKLSSLAVQFYVDFCSKSGTLAARLLVASVCVSYRRLMTIE